MLGPGQDAFGSQLSRLGLKSSSIDGDEEHSAVTGRRAAGGAGQGGAPFAAGRVKASRRLRLKEEGCAELDERQRRLHHCAERGTSRGSIL
jgi:hypothetical protein